MRISKYLVYIDMNKIQIEDFEKFASSFELAKDLEGTRFLITGATGLIGSSLVRALLALHREISITCPVRNLEKARTMYAADADKIEFIECDLLTYLLELKPDNVFQYIVHCASPTAGSYMVAHPVETYELAFESTSLLLKHAHATDAFGMVYVSSLEYYGQMFDDRIITEDMMGYVDMAPPRSSYPLGKQAAEYLCFAYAHEYGVKVKVARLTQTFGAGIAATDNRVFAQFARSIIDNQDIILHTSGESAKPYCYTTDCISAILYILLKGEKGEAYNVANEDTYISIKEMAEFLRDHFNPQIEVRLEFHPEMGYAPVTKLHLSTEKLRSLGWTPKYDLKAMYANLINSMKV